MDRRDRIEPDDEAPNVEAPAAALTSEITPTDGHFVRCNHPVPAVDPERHRVVFDGAFAHPRSLGLLELARRGIRTTAVTLECAGNGRSTLVPPTPGEQWGTGAVSTAIWSGVPLATLLHEAGVRDDVVELVFEGEGGFARSLPVDVALEGDVLLALEMNGAPIPKVHGAPVRLVVPGWYGMASVKWLRSIRAVPLPFRGEYQTERYVVDGAPLTRMRPRAIVTSPAEESEIAAGPALVKGWAWSGHGPIVRLEVTVDGEPIAASLGAAPGPHAWRAWEAVATLTGGEHVLRVRAVDAAGNAQPDEAPWNALGYGNNVITERKLTVR